jgi:predicted lipid-binding transport protein (Tim44 family)
METVFLLVLTGAIFFKIWSILGKKTGHEKKHNSDWIIGQYSDKTLSNNVVILPNNMKNEESISDNEQDDALVGKLADLQKRLPSFNQDKFLNGSSRAFETIVTSFAKGKIKNLEHLLSPDVFVKFKDVIDIREAKKEKIEVEIDNVIANILDVNIQSNQVFIAVQFQSDQMYATISEDGLSFDNPAKLSATIIDTWLFQRELDNNSDIWLLSKTEFKINEPV